MTIRILALFCRICPFCICARMLPKSRLAGAMKKFRTFCPACKAYEQMRAAL